MRSDYAILWDLDGTIVDTKDCHNYTWKQVLKKHGFQLDMGVLDVNFGRNNTTLLPLLLGFEPDDELMMAIIDEKEDLFRQVASDWITLIPGVVSWLETANDLHIQQAIASSAPIENITALLASFNLGDYFSAIVSGSELPAKPEPDVFIRAAEALHTPSENCLVIEDSVAGVAGAKQAGMCCIAITTTHPQAELAQADLVFEDFTRPFHEMLLTIGWE